VDTKLTHRIFLLRLGLAILCHESYNRGMLARIRTGRHPLPTTWLVWLLPVFAWAPLTYPGYFEFFNGFSPVFNLDALWHSAARVGLAWTPAIGQPYDLLRGEGWLPYWLAAGLRLLGLSGLSVVKLVLIAAVLAGAFGTYGWARRSLGPWPGLLAAMVYVFWPLGLATIYVRGAYAEAVLLGLLPWVWWSAQAARTPGRRGAWLGLIITLAAAFWTQPGLALWLSTFVLVCILVSDLAAGRLLQKQATGTRPAWLAPSLAWLLGVALGFLGWLPALLAHGGLGNASYVNFADHLAYPHQLLQPGWALAPSAVEPYDRMPLQLGLVACGLAVLGVVLWSTRTTLLPDAAADSSDPPEISAAGLTMRIWLAVAFVLLPVLLSLVLAAPLWRGLPVLARTLTYPWQLLLLAGPWLAWLAGLSGWVLHAGLQHEISPDRRAPVAVPLFAALLALALLGVYGDLNPPSTLAPVPDRPVAIFGDNQIALVSATISDTVSSRQPTTVTVQAHWQALRPLDQDYTVFVHVLGPDGTQWGQQDTMPKANKLPTTRWRPGQMVDDAYIVDLKPGAPANGPYRYELGLYQYQTGERLSTGQDNKVTLQGQR
jgi:hypothetical protein